MRIITLKGDYGYKKSEVFSGLICMIHFEEKDNIKIIEKSTRKIIALAKTHPIILVPFAHLYENSAKTDTAREFFNNLAKILKNNYSEVIVAPFQLTKELYLYIKADDSLIKFLNF